MKKVFVIITAVALICFLSLAFGIYSYFKSLDAKYNERPLPSFGYFTLL